LKLSESEIIVGLEETLKLIQILHSLPSNSKVDLQSYFSQLTLNIIGIAGFDYDFASLEKDYKEHGENTKGGEAELSVLFYRALASLTPDLFSLLVGRIYKYLPTNRNRERKTMIVALNGTVADIIKRRRQEFNKNTNQEDESKSKDILSLLFNAKDAETGSLLTDLELRDEIKTFILAGHETTSTLLVWVFYCLSLNLESQEKLISEIDQKLQGKFPTPEDVEGTLLPYLNAFMKEVLRIYPPVSIVTRVTASDDILAGYQIPKGTRIVLSPYILHHHPNQWDQPEVFNPDRWMKSTNSNIETNDNLPAQQSVPRHPFSFLPFIFGPRNCIGQKFALVEARMITVMVLQHFNVTLDPSSPELKRTTTITMRPKSTMFFNLRPRKKF